MGLCQAIQFLHRKGSNRVKTQPNEWENVFVNYMTDKGLISLI